MNDHRSSFITFCACIPELQIFYNACKLGRSCWEPENYMLVLMYSKIIYQNESIPKETGKTKFKFYIKVSKMKIIIIKKKH